MVDVCDLEARHRAQTRRTIVPVRKGGGSRFATSSFLRAMMAARYSSLAISVRRPSSIAALRGACVEYNALKYAPSNGEEYRRLFLRGLQK